MSKNFNFPKVFASDVSDRLNRADDYLYTCQDPVASVESAGTAIEQFIRHLLIKEGFAETDFSILKDGRIVQKNAHKILQWCIEFYRLGDAAEYKEPDNKRPMLCLEGVFMPLTSAFAMA